MLLIKQAAVKYIIILCVIIVALIIASIIIALINKNKKGHVKVDSEFINKIIAFLGGVGNIASVVVDNARLKVSVNDLSTVDSNGLHSLSEKGVFISGNNIKMMFKYDSNTIKKEIEKLI